MRILVVCQYYYPEQFRITDVCEQLVRDGHSVTVLTGLPNYPMGRIPREYRWGRRRRETLSGVEVLRCFEIGRRSGSVGLILNYASYAASASFRALFLGRGFDVVLAYQLSPVTMAVPAVVMPKRTGKPLCLYCCDIWPESIKTMVSNEGSLVFRVARSLSRYVYTRCDAILVASKPFISYLHEEHSVPLNKLMYLPGHAEDIYLGISAEPVNNVTDFVFMGNIGIAQGIDCILDATAKIRHVPGFRVHFVGDGAALDASKELVRRLGLGEVVLFHGRRPLQDMPEFYSLADACLVTLSADSRIGLTMPSKLQGYMAAGKPVFGAIDGAAREVIDESGCGTCVAAGDSDGLARVMRSFVEDPARYADCGRNGREYFERHFSKDQFIRGLENGLSRAAEAAALPS